MKSNKAPVFYEIKELKRYLSEIDAGRIVLANGCFDLIHVGHIRYLRGAKEMGDFLLVALNDDAITKRIKGNSRPVVPQNERAEILASLEMVDAVLVFSSSDVVPILEAVRPYCHAKGTDYTVDTVPERDVSKKLGIRVAITGDPKNHSSSDLLSELREDKAGR